jgi:PAS domain S-box-containing protein
MVIGRQGDNGVAGGSFAEGFTRAIAMIDAVGRITMVNAKTERMFGYSRVELLGQPIDMLTPDHFHTHCRELRNSVFGDQRTRVVGAGLNLSGLKKSATEFRIEIVLEYIEGESESEPMILATIVDITDQQRMMAETGYLAAIIDASKDAIISKNLAGIITTWNRAATNLFGYAADEVIGKHISLLIPPDLLNDAERVMARVRGGEICEDAETHRLHKDGRAIVVARTISPIFGSDGNVIGSSKTIRDITAFKASQAALRDSKDRVNDLADSNLALETQIESLAHQRDLAWHKSRDLQLIVDGQGVFLAANEAWTTLLGWRPDEVVGHNHVDFIHPDHHAAAKAALGVAAVGELRVYEDRYRHKDGTYHWVSWVAAPAGGLIYASGRHETAEREAAEKLAGTQEQLRQSQKMELLGQLTGGIAHDFNNLLGIVQLNLELIRERISEDTDADEMAAMALQATGRGASLTHQLLAYARQQPLEPRIVNIETLLSGMAGLLGRTLGESVEIKTIMAADLWTTSIDAHQLENALLNLGVNAGHAMPDGGKLIIEASNKILDDLYVELNPDVAPGSYVAVAVTDTGSGIPPEIMRRVLEPFFTTKPVGKGSGLGLSMVDGFVKQSGGHIKIYSEPGLGTTVSLYLPRAWTGAEDETAANRPEVPASGGGELVMVVEDDPHLRSLTLKILSGLGYRTIEAEDGPAACAIFDHADRIDLLLTDIVLPKGMYGPEIARLARSRLPEIKVLYMSGYPRDAASRDTTLGVGTHLLSKPFSKATLAEMVRQVLDERTGS